MNCGQMLMWHIVLVPIALTAMIGAHILLVRVRGVSHPLPGGIKLPGRGSYRQRRRAVATADAAPWRGATRRYDILKEGTIAAVIMLALTFGLAALLSSPNVPGTVCADLGEGGARRFPGHRVNRAQRHQRDGQLRPAVQHERDPAEDPVRPGGTSSG